MAAWTLRITEFNDAVGTIFQAERCNVFRGCTYIAGPVVFIAVIEATSEKKSGRRIEEYRWLESDDCRDTVFYGGSFVAATNAL